MFDPVALRQGLLDDGWLNFDWKRSSPPKGWGKFGQQAKIKPWHAHHTLYVTASDQRQVEAICGYLNACASRFGVDYAYVDSLAEGYKDYGVICNAAPYRSEIMIPSVKLHKNLPDILWFQVFGPPYVRLFGLDKLLTAPAYKVEQLGPEMVSIQLSESLFDMHERYEEVNLVRQRVKVHLDDNIFFNPAKPEGHVYRTPDFQFPPRPEGAAPGPMVEAS